MIERGEIGELLSDALENREVRPELWPTMTPREAFEEYCEWHGLIRWSNRLFSLVEECQYRCGEEVPVGEADHRSAVRVLARYAVQLAKRMRRDAGQDSDDTSNVYADVEQIVAESGIEEAVAEEACELLKYSDPAWKRAVEEADLEFKARRSQETDG